MGGGFQLTATCYVTKNATRSDSGCLTLRPDSHAHTHNFFQRRPDGIDSNYIYFDDAANWQPGKLGQLEPAAAIEGKQIVGRAGTCTFWDGRTVHTGSPNVRELPCMAAFARWADTESRDCDGPIYFVHAAKLLCHQHCRPCPHLSTQF